MAPDAAPPALEKEDIQSPILRRRPAPYIGCHVLLHFADGAQAREFLRRLLPHIISAAHYASADTWAAIAFTYTACRLSVFRKRLSTPFRRHFAKAWPRARRPLKNPKTVCRSTGKNPTARDAFTQP